ncbi:MAG: aminomethyl-transferring glycine dehydrogenase subunit GcvPA [Ruthenibacterium sp.]
MGSFIPSTAPQRADMLKTLGVTDCDALFVDIPEKMRLEKLDLPNGISEPEVLRTMREFANQNRVFDTCFRGAGAYDHFIPSIVKRVTAKEEFVTAYTPYQAEVSQGILQSIFEYQTMICELTGMAVSNASVYDGASAAAEASAMCRDRKRVRTLVSGAVNPEYLQVLRTYCHGANAPVEVVPVKDGVTDLNALQALLQDTDACFYFAQPNFFGCLEDADALVKVVHDAGAKVIMGVNPIAAALLKTPGECGADIAVGEGQPLGMPLSFGGPYLGFMAAVPAMMRRLPGRIVGETVDDAGRRCFVLTLQAREQHIRREKASSNICSNEALCAMTAAVYLAATGTDGLTQIAQQCTDKAHYLAENLAQISGYSLLYSAPFFHEFVMTCPDADGLLAKLEENGILGGLPVAGGILWCATEKNTKAQMDRVIALAKEAAHA